MAETSTSSSSGSSQQTSSSTPIQTPENEIMMQIAAIAQQYAQSTFNWAQNTFQDISNVTADNMGRLLDVANQAGGLGTQAAQQYLSQFPQLAQSLISDANSYAGQDRIASEMGMAESGAAQSMDQARLNAEQDLQKYGISPDSGRYAALDRIARTQGAAAGAAAGTAARLNTEQTGRNLRGQAIQMEQQLPGQAINSFNTATQGITSAENANLANANTGAALMSVANPYLATAMGIKNPPMASQSQGSSAQRSNSNANKPDPNQNAGQGQPNAGQPGRPAIPQADTPSAIKFGQSFTAGKPIDPGSLPNTDPLGDFTVGGDYAQFNGDPFAPTAQDYGAFGENPTSQPSMNPNDYTSYMPTPDNFGAFGENPTSQDTSSQDSGDQSATYLNNNFDTSGGYDESNDWAEGGSIGDDDDSQPQQYAALPPPGQTAPGAGSPFREQMRQQDNRDNAPMRTTGGQVHQSMSPSGGRKTDDVNAHLNADEFVVPKDVARWKGEEFFHGLIAKSREARAKMSQGVGGKPSQRPTNGPPSFVSQQV